MFRKYRITNDFLHNVTINAGRAESNSLFLNERSTDLLVENHVVYI